MNDSNHLGDLVPIEFDFNVLKKSVDSGQSVKNKLKISAGSKKDLMYSQEDRLGNIEEVEEKEEPEIHEKLLNDNSA